MNGWENSKIPHAKSACGAPPEVNKVAIRRRIGHAPLRCEELFGGMFPYEKSV